MFQSGRPVRCSIVFAMAFEIERDLISKRIKESLAAKKLSGIKPGRPNGPR